MARLARLGVAPFRCMAPALVGRPCLGRSSAGHAGLFNLTESPVCGYTTYSTLPSAKLPTALSVAHQQQTLSEVPCTAALKEPEGQLTSGEDTTHVTTKAFANQDACAPEEPQQRSVRSTKKTIKKNKTFMTRDKEPAIQQDACTATKDSAKQGGCASEEPQQCSSTHRKKKMSKKEKLVKKDKEPAVPQDEDCQIHPFARIKNISLARLGKADLVSTANDAPDKLKYKKKKQKQTTQRKRYYTQDVAGVLAYLEACITTGELDLAQRCLQRLEKSTTYGQYLRTSMYNILIHAWAKRGCMLQVAQLFSNMKKLMVNPDLSSYVGALECMGRAEHCTEILLNRFLQDMEQNGFTLQYMFDRYPFFPEERELGLHTVRRVRPDFSWQYQHRNSHYSLPLIAECYDQVKKEMPSFPRLPFTANELRQMFRKQLAMEEAGFVTVESVKVSKSVNPDTASQRKGRIEHLRSHWRQELLLAFRDAKSKINPRRANHFGTSIYPFLLLLPEEDYIDIMIMVMTTLPPNGEAMIVFAKDLGRKVQSRFCIKRKQKLGITALVTKVYDHYVELLASDGKVHDKFPREYWQELERDLLHWYAYGHQDVNWSDATTMQLGTFLANVMVSGMNIPKNAKNPLQQRLIPAVYHTYNYQSKRKIGFIKPHPLLTQILESDQNSSLIFDAFVMPTYCPPVPWTSPTFGGYIVVPTQLIRMEEGITKQRDLLDHCKEEDPSKLHVILDTVNQLGNCPWHINEEVLDVIISLFNSGGSTQLGVPPPPSAGPILPKYDPTGKTGIADRTAYNNDMRLARKTLFEMHSLHMDAEYKLSIANALRHRTFWFPHNIDFRGRSYSCPPHFNHIGSDTTRSLLQFAEGQPLGPNGFDWLKIHLVNLMGRNKCESLSERLRYANAHMEDILDSADRPLEGHRWWMKSDEPWQTLACCKEIAKAVRSPDPAAFISHLPVHQDGSCNGLQHYAALGRDVVGAASVNLIPHERPQDVYEVVAQKVEQHRLRDAANGLQIAQVLEGFVNRKVVKQTVMTVVYGVTRYGARLQVEKRLDELEDFPKAHVWKASIYLSRGIFHSLKEMFASTREIQEWLTESARLISMAGYSVEWISPVGLPIIQPYHHIKKPHTMKQKNAFPPNFIHSLDSTHMMLTALNCYRKGLTFVSIHDCFWTHAKTVDIMNQVCREQFVALHSQPILENLSKFLLRKHSGLLPEKTKERERHLKLLDVLTRVPKKGDFRLQQVMDSVYFFS